MTLDPRTFELLHLELDGRLDDAGRAELEANCQSDPAVARHREELRRVVDQLDGAAFEEVPGGFADGVMDRSGLRSTKVVRLPAAPRARYWRMGMALAASAAFLVVALNVLGPINPGTSEHLSGSMAPATPVVRTQATDRGQRLRFRVPPGAAGQIDIRFKDGKRIVIPLAEAEERVVVETGAGEFLATLTRAGSVTPITIRND